MTRSSMRAVAGAALALAAFRSGAGRWVKGGLWVLAMLLFLYITTVAVLREPAGILTLL